MQGKQMQFPDDDNGKMLAAMQDAGMDLTQKLMIDFFLIFDDQRDGESALQELTKSNVEGDAELNLNDELGKWELIVTLNMLPEYDLLINKEQELNQFAQNFGGMSDGWGVMQHQDGDAEFADDHECGDDCHH